MSLRTAGATRQQADSRDDHEQIARDFIAAFGSGNPGLVEMFLHPKVVYQADASSTVHGRRDVVLIYERLFQRFESIQFKVVNLAVTDQVVIAELSLRIAMPGRRSTSFLSFASLEIRGGQIAAWRQLHG